jgi:nicotinate-nucleotide pyrophosphorylase (carboxylating)
MPEIVDRYRLRKMWEDAIEEDGAENDITSLVATPPQQAICAHLMAREAGVFAGNVIFDVLKEAYPTELTINPLVDDGIKLEAGSLIAEIAGSARRILAVERTLLNFLQRLCGIASATRTYVDAVAGTPARIYDTRKTMPGWRQLDKYAVRCGGGRNHRMGLHDAVLVKDNHLAGFEPNRLRAAVLDMLKTSVALSPQPAFIEFEVDTLDQFNQIVTVPGIDVILLDNFSLADMRKAVARRNDLGLLGKLQLEASGGVNLARVADIAATGIERISIGSITHSVRAMDLALDIHKE